MILRLGRGLAVCTVMRDAVGTIQRSHLKRAKSCIVGVLTRYWMKRPSTSPGR